MRTAARSFAPGELRRSLPEIVIAALAAVMIMFEIWVFDPGGWTLGRTVAGAGAALSLAFLRQAPFAACVVNGLSIYALIALGFSSEFYQWTNFVALLVAASRVPLAKALVCLVMGYVGVGLYFLRFPNEGPPVLAGAILAVWTAGWFAGRAQRARVLGAAANLGNQVARAELAAQQFRAELEAERTRIAQELHDVVGHAVNVMVVHAGAGEGLAARDPKAKEVFATIAAAGRRALADLDRMLDVLQGNADRATADRNPLPGIAELESLCASVRETGLDVDLRLADAAKAVSPSVGLSAYRIVQEALTNVIKHAHATSVHVDVDLHDADDALVITVRDNGSGGQPEPGRGLGGMAARAALHDGSLQYGPAPDRGFELAVRLASGASR